MLQTGLRINSKPLGSGVKNVFSTGGQIFSGIKEGIEKTFKTVVNGIIDGINKIVKVPFDAINGVIGKIKIVEIASYKPFDFLPTISVPQIPRLWQGGILEKGETGFLEGNGAEAVVPLERNKYWIKRVTEELYKQLNISSLIEELKEIVSSSSLDFAFNKNILRNNANGFSSQSNINNFTQIINAPKQPSRLELYRQTKNLLNLVKS